MSNPYRESFDRFLETIQPWAEGYTRSGISAVAVLAETTWSLVHARVFLTAEPIVAPSEAIRTSRLLATHFRMESSRESLFSAIEKMFSSGVVTTPIGRLNLPSDPSGSLSSHFQPFHPAGNEGQNSLPVFSISGGSNAGLLNQPCTDWELRASTTPFDSLSELTTAYVLGGYAGSSSVIEIVARPVALIAADSTINDTEARIGVLLARNLDHLKCRIGFRVLSNRVVVNRGSFSGEQISWGTGDIWKRGDVRLQVPQAAVVQCFASYADAAHHYFWISDPRNYQNPLRMALQATDNELEVIRDYLFEERKPRKESRDFEQGVAMLAWMLGFATAPIGATPRLSDAPDLIGATPKGDMLIVECTTGLLKAENKLARLAERAQAIRQRLDSSGNGHVRVQPVIVTALERAAVEGEAVQAMASGISVATRETLRDLLARTVGVASAQAVFDEIWNAVRPAASLPPGGP